MRIAQNHGASINDLYPLMENVPSEYYIDTTHPYTPEGAQILTNAVLKALCEALDLEYKEFSVTYFEEIKEILGI